MTAAPEPSLTPPRPWTDSNEEACWFPGAVGRRTYADQMPRQRRHALAEVLSRLQGVPWRINRRVLHVVQEAQRRGVAVGRGQCGASIEGGSQGLPTLRGSAARSDLVRSWHRGRSLGLKAFPAAAARGADETQAMAEALAEHGHFYLPLSWTLCEGIRPIAAPLDPQGSDLAQGLLEYAEGRAITQGCPDGEAPGNGGDGWLVLHVAACFGQRDGDRAAQIGWVFEHEARFRRIAADPLADLLWAEAERPWSALAAVFDLVALLDEGYGYASRLPVSTGTTPLFPCGFEPWLEELLTMSLGAAEAGIALVGLTTAPCVTHAADAWRAVQLRERTTAVAAEAQRSWTMGQYELHRRGMGPWQTKRPARLEG